MSEPKIKATREDVLSVLAMPRFADRPLSAPEIAREIADMRGGEWADPFVRMSRNALVQLLEDMTLDFTLVMDLGGNWSASGVNFYDQRPGVRYWTTRELAREWRRKREAAEQAARDSRLQEEAEQHAWRVLAERYPEEFAALVKDYRAEHGAAVAEGAGK